MEKDKIFTLFMILLDMTSITISAMALTAAVVGFYVSGPINVVLVVLWIFVGAHWTRRLHGDVCYLFRK